ncbi:hypothetical protein Ancab_019083 [Ancistrocladus abbreviatus]
MKSILGAYKLVQGLISSKSAVRTKQNGYQYLNSVLYHCTETSHEELLPLQWYEDVFPRLRKLSHFLKNVDLVDGKLVDVSDNSNIRDERMLCRMHNFKSLAKVFLGATFVQEELQNNIKAAMTSRKLRPFFCFSTSNEREPVIVNSLSTICNFLNISAQQRKVVRLTICSQVTQHEIWTGALEEILKGLKIEMESLECPDHNKGTYMGRQIVSSCLKFLAETSYDNDQDSSSWMRPKPQKVVDYPTARKWEEVLEMFNDLVNCLRGKEDFLFHVSKLEVMREGLAQIKDVIVEKNIGYKEVKHQQSLVQKKLVKTLGLPSKCLFTLLQYYLYGTIRDMEVEISGGTYEIGGQDRLCLCMGKVVTSNGEKMIWSGVKQLDRSLGLFKFVWETAGMKGILELQGHIWCVGAEHMTLTYRGKLFFIHGISL